MSWSEPQLITPPPYTAVKAAHSASCPTTTFCAVGDDQGNVLTSTNPTGGSSAWTATHIDADNAISAIACPSASLCVGGDDAGNLLTSTAPGTGAAAWSRAPFTPNERITAIACPSASLCVAGDQDGGLYTSTNPTGGAGAWTKVESLGADVLVSDISCPSTGLCVAVRNGFHSGLLVSTNPGGGAGAWSETEVPASHNLTKVSCATNGFCIAVDSDGSFPSSHTTLFYSTNPTGGTAAWQSEAVETNRQLEDIACPSSTLCVALDEFGQILTSTAPTDAASWFTESVNGAPLALTCASTALCVAVKWNGILTSTHVNDPNAGRWQSAKLGENVSNTLEDVACPGASLCLAVDHSGELLRATDPTGGADAWTTESIDNAALTAITCPAASFCAAADTQGAVLISTDPTGNAATWTKTTIDAGHELDTIGCASATLCVAWSHGNGQGHILTSTNPTGGAAAWESWDPNIGSTMEAIACPSSSLCVASGGGGIYTSTNPAAGGSTWQSAQLSSPFDSVYDVSCPTATFCAAVDFEENVLTSTNPAGGAGAWTSTHIGEGQGCAPGASSCSTQPYSTISCPSASLCMAASGVNGSIATSTNPTGGAAAWSFGSVGNIQALSCPSASLCVGVGYGVGSYPSAYTTSHPTSVSWTSAVVKNAASSLNQVSCPTNSFCAAVNEHGDVLSTTNPSAPGAWTISDTAHYLDAISCASTALCVASGGNEILSSTNPTSGSPSWTGINLPVYGLPAVACPTAGFCAATDMQGDILTSTNPTGNAASWSVVNVDGSNTLWAISCPTESFCAAVDRSGNILTSTNPTGGSGAWHSHSLGLSFLYAFPDVSCSGVTFCVVTAQDSYGGAQLYTSTNPTAASPGWTGTAGLDPGGWLMGVSCASPTFCAAISVDGRALVSSDPTGAASTWSPTLLDRLHGLNSLEDISCPTSSFCEAVNQSGFGIAGSSNGVSQYSLTVSKAGTGSGTVTSTPAGIDCGATCSHSFGVGASIELVAAPAPGSTFTGWSGAGCSGTGPCEFTLSADSTITATFTAPASDEGGGGGGGSNSPGGGGAASISAPSSSTPSSHQAPIKCRKGFKKQKVRGKIKCVKVAKHHRHGGKHPS